MKEKCACVTHSMYAHEYANYNNIVPAALQRDSKSGEGESRNKIACNTSIYWAASTIGQMSIAFALHAGVAFIDDTLNFEQQKEQMAEMNVNMLGIAPTVLKDFISYDELTQKTTA